MARQKVVPREVDNPARGAEFMLHPLQADASRINFD